MENKSTDCCGLASLAELSHSELSDSRLTVCEAGSSMESSSESLTNTLHSEVISETRDALFLLLESVRHAEVFGPFEFFSILLVKFAKNKVSNLDQITIHSRFVVNLVPTYNNYWNIF